DPLARSRFLDLPHARDVALLATGDRGRDLVRLSGRARGPPLALEDVLLAGPVRLRNEAVQRRVGEGVLVDPLHLAALPEDLRTGVLVVVRERQDTVLEGEPRLPVLRVGGLAHVVAVERSVLVQDDLHGRAAPDSGRGLFAAGPGAEHVAEVLGLVGAR